MMASGIRDQRCAVVIPGVRASDADVNRALVLRTASNFDLQPPDLTAAESMAGEKIGHYSAFIPSLEAAHRVGSKVVHELVKNWDKFETEIPSAPVAK